MSRRTAAEALATYHVANYRFEESGKRYPALLDEALVEARDIIRLSNAEGTPLEKLVPDEHTRNQILAEAKVREDWMDALE